MEKLNFYTVDLDYVNYLKKVEQDKRVIAGIIVAADIRGADANNAGLWLELDAILAVVIGGGSLMGGRFNLLLSVVGALIIQGMNTGILLSGFPPEMNQVVKAVVVLCVLIVQSQRFISLIKGVRNRDKT